MVVENRCFKESSKGWFSAKSRPFIGMVLALVMAVNFTPFQVYAQGDGQRYFQRSDASQPSFTRADSLRGGVTAERAWWDLTHYHLQVAVDIEARALSESIVCSTECARAWTSKPSV
jgi:hypothetical protein